jgi:hypothetical protein
MIGLNTLLEYAMNAAKYETLENHFGSYQKKAELEI